MDQTTLTGIVIIAMFSLLGLASLWLFEHSKEPVDNKE